VNVWRIDSDLNMNSPLFMSKRYKAILGISAVGKSIGKMEMAFIICAYYYALGNAI